MEAKRIYWIDWIKVFALYLVVLGHLVSGVPGKIIYSFHMPLFFFLSGILHRNKCIKDYFERLVIPYIMLNIAMFLLEFPWLYRQYGNVSFCKECLLNILLNMQDPINYPTWFLVTLFTIKVILHYCKTSKYIIVCSMFFFILSLFNLDKNLPFSLDRTCSAFVYFSFGLFFKDYLNRLVSVSKCKKILTGGGVVACFIIVAIVSGTIWIDTYQHPQVYIIATLGIAGCILIAESLLANKKNLFILNISKGALAIVGFHPLLIQYFRRIFAFFDFNWSEKTFGMAVLIALTIMFLIALAIPFIIKYAPILIGISKK